MSTEADELKLTSDEQAALAGLSPSERELLEELPVLRKRVAGVAAKWAALPEDRRAELLKEQADAEHAARLAQLEADIARRLTKVPRRYRGVTVRHPQVATWVKGFLEGDPSSMLITGGTGSGKTEHVWAIFTEVIGSGYERGVEYYRVVSLMSDLRPGAAVDPEVLRVRLGAVGLLILDDLGAEKASEWTEEQLYQIVDERYMWERPTVVTSNLVASQLGSSVGDRVASRLAEMCSGYVIGMDDPDWRRR